MLLPARELEGRRRNGGRQVGGQGQKAGSGHEARRPGHLIRLQPPQRFDIGAARPQEHACKAVECEHRSRRLFHSRRVERPGVRVHAGCLAAVAQAACPMVTSAGVASKD